MCARRKVNQDLSDTVDETSRGSCRFVSIEAANFASFPSSDAPRDLNYKQDVSLWIKGEKQG